MEIQYLNYLLDNAKIIQGKYYETLEVLKIETLENEINKSFPKAYKEFLYLTGGRPKIYDSGIDGGFTFTLERQQYTKELLAENGFTFKQDIWVIAELDGGEQFDFFIFNDPTAEDPENPPVYFFDANYFDDGVNASEKNISRSFETFSEYVEGNASVRMEEKGYL